MKRRYLLAALGAVVVPAASAQEHTEANRRKLLQMIEHLQKAAMLAGELENPLLGRALIGVTLGIMKMDRFRCHITDDGDGVTLKVWDVKHGAKL